ncbi:uncharacterized protein LOC103730874 [Nannospalax galili]|uniref:uncharacterized protein LOC103730874 n=1 Tax=Nannospalax galili TaxID=1026970 RepID=UPI0004ED1665|nr:uncharacterized protein LOC103730874 [Nannospalax galili]
MGRWPATTYGNPGQTRPRRNSRFPNAAASASPGQTNAHSGGGAHQAHAPQAVTWGGPSPRTPGPTRPVHAGRKGASETRGPDARQHHGGPRSSRTQCALARCNHVMIRKPRRPGPRTPAPFTLKLDRPGAHRGVCVHAPRQHPNPRRGSDAGPERPNQKGGMSQHSISRTLSSSGLTVIHPTSPKSGFSFPRVPLPPPQALFSTGDFYTHHSSSRGLCLTPEASVFPLGSLVQRQTSLLIVKPSA